MKYAFMTFSCPELSLDDALALAKRLGYDGIEPRIVAKHKHGIEIEADAATREAAKAKAEAAGVALSCVATSCKYADPSAEQEQLDTTLGAIDLAADVGAPCIRVFGGVLPEGMKRGDAMDQLVKCLSAVADRAAERDVTVCMETHDDWCNPEHVAEVMERVDHSAIAVNWDIMHPVRRAGSTIDASFQALQPWIRHLHVHDGITEADGAAKLAPIGTGIVDHRRAIELLLGMDYQGFISGEWINWEPYETCLPRELATMKGYEQELAGA